MRTLTATTLLILLFSAEYIVADDATPSGTRPPPAGSAGSEPAPGPEIKPIGGGTVKLEPINAKPVTREDAPGNQFMSNPACDSPLVLC